LLCDKSFRYAITVQNTLKNPLFSIDKNPPILYPFFGDGLPAEFYVLDSGTESGRIFTKRKMAIPAHFCPAFIAESGGN
jgi:hypothetical protein